jgi:hypothetical protein
MSDGILTHGGSKDKGAAKAMRYRWELAHGCRQAGARGAEGEVQGCEEAGPRCRDRGRGDAQALGLDGAYSSSEESPISWENEPPTVSTLERMSVLAKELVVEPMPADESDELRSLFHRLNNELGIILSHAELLEAKSVDDISRSRAAQVVASVLDAMGTARAIRARLINGNGS